MKNAVINCADGVGIVVILIAIKIVTGKCSERIAILFVNLCWKNN